MASSSSKRKKNYDVFLSFRGTDVRNNFLGHLYTAVNQNGIFTYIDSEEMRKGEAISPALMKAIEESRIAIIIFSKDYASSPWCLEEVAKIMECKLPKDLIVWPVFYKVEPREVRGATESYGEAMAKHESQFGKDSEKVKRWRKALFDAASLSGWSLKDGDEAELIKRIAKEISMQLDRMPLHVARYPVGLCPRVIELESMLNLKSDDVLMIGLWGPGGIGKTTVGKALYNEIFRQYEGSCFLPNVREASKDPKDLVSLQEKLLSELLPGQRLVVSSVDKGIKLMQDRLYCKKVLLVLDDINDVDQLNALAGECEWFGEGSRIIITTRDKHLLTYHGIDEDHIYEVEPLEYCDALELLNRHAYQKNNKILIGKDLVDGALHYADGLPLALKELGYTLCGRAESEWESTLHRLAKSPNKTINDALKLSYNGLEHYLKEIFLDIGCFFKGQSKEYITEVLDSCDFDTTSGVPVLIEKSLIIEQKKTLQMRNPIQSMAMDIIKQECPYDPGKRSRLWLFDDFRKVLSRHMVTDALQSIVLHLPKPEKINIGLDALTNIRNLRKLIMINVHNSFPGPIYLPDELRWFEWPECRPCIQESSSSLAQLHLHESNIQALEQQQFKKATDFSERPSLVYVPNIDWFPSFKALQIPRIEVPSIGNGGKKEDEVAALVRAYQAYYSLPVPQEILPRGQHGREENPNACHLLK